MTAELHADYMRRAIEVARANPRAPFGALLVNRNTGAVVAEGVNRSHQHPIWHGEIDVINQHAAVNGSIPDWSELHLYTTAEPCPMCQAAILWAGIPRVIYGVSIQRLQELGWNQINILSHEVARRASFTTCSIVAGVLAQECEQLFREAFVRRSA